MNISKANLEKIIRRAYSLGYDDRVNQEGYNIAALEIRSTSGEVVRSRLIDPKVTKRPRHLSKKRLIELAMTAAQE